MPGHFDTIIVNGGDFFAPNIIGTSLNDEILAGGNAARYILAGAGDDFVFSGLGNYSANGGSGNDVLFSPDVSSAFGGGLMSGGDGNDLIITGERPDIISGGNGDDILGGSQKSDFGGGGRPDTFQFQIGFGHDTLLDFSFEDGDRLNFYDSVSGLGGARSVTSVGQLHDLVAQAGLQVTNLDHGNILIDFGGGNTITFMGFAGEFGVAAGVAVRLAGTSHDDTLLGSSQDDVLLGGAGDDILLGGYGNDRLEGGNGDDEVVAGDGNDLLSGGDGNDYVFGGNGIDILNGGQGDDILSGGSSPFGGSEGGDRFQFSAAFGHDTAVDFDLNSGGTLTFFAGAIDASNHTVSSLADLDALVFLGGFDVTDDSVASTIDFHNGNSLTLVNFSYDAVAHTFSMF